ncbi:hypothetical protein JDV02_001720 [Purpureocillium takamizusanense]|uniref:Uncharacterized protein n=1 Tax=Purpureocillium takamizusanense TaxID=2060973 RepID=A0A9Q8QA68_9HYPO|nr:uncharacterized protein JDV02_001720 [Purpureocillium takamizusanense]UNI15157.1 hypothetical protein JDV02_001720 [Purpureocillium takamizusanense]
MTLESHDVAFPLPARSEGRSATTFRILLLSSSQANTPDARARIDRLSMLDGEGKAAVILLLEEPDGMDSFMELQMWMLDTEGTVSIIPVASAAELPSCLDSLRRQCDGAAPDAVTAAAATTTTTTTPTAQHELLRTRELLSHCYSGGGGGGGRLTTSETNVLSDICTGFADLARHAYDPASRRKLADYLGDAQAAKVISFFTAGPGTRRG